MHKIAHQIHIAAVRSQLRVVLNRDGGKYASVGYLIDGRRQSNIGNQITVAPGISVPGDTSQAIAYVEHHRVGERVGIVDRCVLESLVHRIAAAWIDNVAPEIGLAIQTVHKRVAPEDALPLVETVVQLELDAILW